MNQLELFALHIRKATIG
uniref:Uncharacterized protein n=1 Tax=Anguilla anguilla TaxID=7936 RepID=A0A0E9RI86_ANGAN